MVDSAPPPLHELETEVMEEVWASGEVTVHAVRDELNARSDRQRAYSTVMTVMSRLRTKGLLKKERRGRSDYYVAALTRDEYMDARAGSQVETLVAEYGDLALAHFAAHVAKLDRSRRQKLRRLAQRD
ncbi:MAG TPA: BlaI/MecI/CopY family transcriptional regulator [Solirubrobacteraceae bacterium]|nr:BlaI/MecI/CopY family transcriptional regulator [Solirubrobacteraceae bacterium]